MQSLQMAQLQRRTLWQKVRKTLNDIHLWLGIASGIILFLVCLSGTIYTFSTEIQEKMSPEKYKVNIPQGAERLPADTIVSKISSQVKGKLLFINIPSDKSRSYQISIQKKEPSKAKEASVVKDTSELKEASAVKNTPESKEPSQAKEASAAKDTLKSGEPSSEAKEVLAVKDASKSKEASGTKGSLKTNEGKKPKQGEKGRGPKGTFYFVDPYTGVIKDTAQSTGSPFFLSMFRLHRWLLLDQEIGRPIVGAATLIFVFIIITGLVIWFPQKVKNWRQGLKIKFSANWKRVNHDLHNSLGFYSSFLLLIMALTGLTWSFPWYKDGVNKLLGVYKPAGQKEEPLKSEISADKKMLPLSVFLKQADELLPYEGNYMLNFPADSSASVSITKTQVGFFAPVAGDKIQFDQYTGKVLKLEIFREKPFNERVAGSIRALHVGNVYGTFTKIVYFIACLIATSLPVTGTLIWINKLKKRRKKRPAGVDPDEED